MRSALIATALASVTLVALPAPLVAQENKTARGTVSAISDDSLTVKMADHEMKFAVDAKTHVEAIGASTKSKQAQAAGQPGPKLTEVLKAGQPVTVTYSESGGSMKAVSIRAISSAGSPASGAGASATKTSTGTVKSIAATSMTLSGSGGAGSTFTQTFTIDSSTKVIGKGAGTASAAAGGKTVVTDLVGTGDAVSVTYHEMGSTLHAAEIRVTTKGK